MELSENRVYDLRIPGVGQFMSSMANGVAEALAGQKSAQDALDDVAKEWAGIVDRIGEDRLRDAYANVVRLEDNEG
jgi:multiple sugar transport system substrate-binding protein